MKRGEIWIINLDPTMGSEMQKSRPCIILNNDTVGKLALKVIAPLTDYKAHYALIPWMVTIEPTSENGLKKRSTIDLFQVRSLSQKRLVQKVGNVEKGILKACRTALDTVFD